MRCILNGATCPAKRKAACGMLESPHVEKKKRIQRIDGGDAQPLKTSVGKKVPEKRSENGTKPVENYRNASCNVDSSHGEWLRKHGVNT